MRCTVPLDFIPELCCSPRQSQRGHKLGSHTLLIVLPLLQSGVVADADGQEERASDGIRRAWECINLRRRRGGDCSIKDKQMGRQIKTTVNRLTSSSTFSSSISTSLAAMLSISGPKTFILLWKYNNTIMALSTSRRLTKLHSSYEVNAEVCVCNNGWITLWQCLLYPTSLFLMYHCDQASTLATAGIMCC